MRNESVNEGGERRRLRLLWASRSLLSIACLFLVGALAFAIEITGTLVGTVTDAQGGAIVGADVTVTNSDTGVQSKTVTVEGGYYNLADLPPGKYDVSVEFKGFKTSVSTGNIVQVEHETRVDFQLSPGEVSERLTVTAAAPLVGSTTSDLSTTLEETQINNLPLNARLMQNLVSEAPGATPGGWGDQDENPAASGFQGPSGNGFGSYYAVNGFFFGGDYWLVDGVHDNEPENDYLTMNIPLLDIQEFSVETSNPTAEYGTFGGAVVQIETRSGTNNWHGGAFDYVRNNAFDAVDDLFNPTATNSPYHANQFGGAVGGPIRKNKLFIYGDFQQLRQSGGGVSAIEVPTAAERGGNLSAIDSSKFCQGGGSGLCGPIDPPSGVGAAICTTFATANRLSSPAPCGQSAALLAGCTALNKALCGYDIIPAADIPQIISNSLNAPAAVAGLPTIEPSPNVSTCLVPNVPGNTCNNFTYGQSNTENDPQFDVKADYSLSDNDKIFARASYLYRNYQSAGPTPYLPGGPYAINGNDLDAVGWDHIFSPTTINEFRIGYNRYKTSDWVNADATTAGQMIGNTIGITNGNVSALPSTFGMPSFDGSNGYDGNPGNQMDGLQLPGGADDVPDGLGREANIVEFNDTLSTTWGRQSFKFGTDIEILRMTVLNPQVYPPGTFVAGNSYADTYTGYTFADDLLGAYSVVERDVFTDQPWNEVSYDGFFAQDDVRLTPKITLNLGMRYDIYTAPVEAHNFQSNFVSTGPNAGLIELASASNRGPNVSTYLRNFEPRLGIAYSPDGGKTALRAGFGISDFPANFGGNAGTNERNYPETLQENNDAPSPAFGQPGTCFANMAETALIYSGCTSSNNPEDALLITCGLPGTSAVTCTTPGDSSVVYPALAAPTPTTCKSGSGECLAPPVGFSVFDVEQNFRQDEAFTWNISVERQLTHDMSFYAAYVGNDGRHLYNNYQINTCFPLTGVPLTEPGCLPFNSTGFEGQVNARNSESASDYQAGQFQLIKRTSVGLTLQVSYTWSHMFSNFLNQEDPFDTQMRTAGVGWETSNFPQVFTASYVYDLPFGKGRPWASGASTVENEIIGGWQIAGVTTFRAGGALGIGASGSLPGNVSSYSSFANFTCPLGGASNPHTPGEWFNTSCFTTPANYTLGDGTSGDVYGPGLQNWDFTVTKRFDFGEQRNLQLAFQFFNLFNHPNLSNPNTGCNTGAGVNCSESTNGFGSITSDIGNPRSMAIYLGFNF